MFIVYTSKPLGRLLERLKLLNSWHITSSMASEATTVVLVLRPLIDHLALLAFRTLCHEVECAPHGDPTTVCAASGGVEAANAMEAVPLRIFRESETIHRWRLLNCHEFCHEKPSEYNFSN